MKLRSMTTALVIQIQKDKMAASRKLCRACVLFSNLRARVRLTSSCPRRYTSSNSAPEKENETHFGFEKVPESEKTERVHQVFSNVATTYDTMNDAMSLGIHRLWKDRFMQVLRPTPGTQLLDVAGGTGDIAFRYLDYLSNSKESTGLADDWSDDDKWTDMAMEEEGLPPQTHESEEEKHHVTVCDINENMLKVGSKRAKERGIYEGISWVAGNAEELPLADDCMDAYTIAFGIRNVTRIDLALDEAYRVLKPGGRFLCLEFSQVQNPLFRMIYDRYSFDVIPVLGDVIAGDWKSYQYLVESIRQFPNQEEFSEMIRDAGFSLVRHENLSLGIAAIHSGFKL